jgi:hypothetical protein
MTFRFPGAAAALVSLALATSAAAQTGGSAASSSPGTSQAQADDAKPAKRSRSKAATAVKGEKKEPTAGQMAARERQRKCAAEWKTAKAGGKVADGMKWPKFWSQCNARLKGNSV